MTVSQSATKPQNDFATPATESVIESTRSPRPTSPSTLRSCYCTDSSEMATTSRRGCWVGCASRCASRTRSPPGSAGEDPRCACRPPSARVARPRGRSDRGARPGVVVPGRRPGLRQDGLHLGPAHRGDRAARLHPAGSLEDLVRARGERRMRMRGFTARLARWAKRPAIELAAAAAALVMGLLLVLMRGEQLANRYDEQVGSWVIGTRRAALLITYVMNTWQAYLDGSPKQIFIHSVPPILVFCGAEALVQQRQTLTRVV